MQSQELDSMILVGTTQHLPGFCECLSLGKNYCLVVSLSQTTLLFLEDLLITSLVLKVDVLFCGICHTKRSDKIQDAVLLSLILVNVIASSILSFLSEKKVSTNDREIVRNF